jgi:zinc D-Ala-D-Ala dipeptidase
MDRPDGLPDDFVSISDPAVIATPVVECGEPLVDVRTAGLRVSATYADPDGAWAHLRRDVVDRLLAAQAQLPSGTALLVVEGHRPMALQDRYFTEHVGQLAALYADRSPDELRTRAALHVAPPEAAAHCTGGAVDVTLCDAITGSELDLGSAVNATPEESEERCFTGSSDLPPQASARRELLVGALGGAGLVNYPSEWWHWSYGDRYWAHLTGAPHAPYGPVDAPWAR